MHKSTTKAISGRNDLSKFMIHLTRDDTKDFENGQSAFDNFCQIVDERKIRAFQPHCIHQDEIPDSMLEDFAVCCFTEVPLTELHLLTRYIRGRRVQLSDYGFVFSREFLLSRGAQPAIYINSYGGKSEVRDAADEMFNIVKGQKFKQGKLRRLLPYINAMHEKYDFTWEREWRIRGNLDFRAQDVVCVVLPEDGEDELMRKFLKSGVPVISPSWPIEEIVSQFSKQARRIRRVWKDLQTTQKTSKREKRSK